MKRTVMQLGRMCRCGREHLVLVMRGSIVIAFCPRCDLQDDDTGGAA